MVHTKWKYHPCLSTFISIQISIHMPASTNPIFHSKRILQNNMKLGQSIKSKLGHSREPSYINCSGHAKKIQNIIKLRSRTDILVQ